MPPAPNNQIPKPVVHSLYRSLLKEVKLLDTSPVLKLLMPIPPKFQSVLGMDSPLYIPRDKTYAALVREHFRTTQKPDPNLGFDALSRIRMHVSKVGMLLPVITKEHVGLMAALDSEKATSSQYQAKLADFNASPKLLLPPPAAKGASKKSKSTSVARITPPSSLETAQKLRVGMGLIAHPLSSAHVDRRVMLVVDVNPAVTTAVVLDMKYAFPLSAGNPMFPEVLWGHDVYSGGYYHVDFTMPPTANVAVLHTLEPAEDAKGREHELLCKPVIKGETLPNGTKIPTLYFSKSEALPYLASLCPGKPRSSVRVYWGVMKWPTQQIEREVMKGHWMPVEVSANFFKAYPFAKGQTTDVELFPTETALKEGKEARVRTIGADISAPQVFNPNPMLWGRESLWDQILYSMGGEFKEFVGTVNPFSNPRADLANLASSDILTETDQDTR